MGFKARSVGSKRLFVGFGLELRRWTLADADEFFACVERNRSHLRRWMPWLDMTQSVDDLRGFLHRSIADYEGGLSFRLALVVDGKIAGVVALEEIETMHRRAKIGYWLDKAVQGRGYMRAAVRVMIEHAFRERGMMILELRAATENHRSRAVAESVGMVYECSLRQREWLYDRYVDHAVYSLLVEEWREQVKAQDSAVSAGSAVE